MALLWENHEQHLRVATWLKSVPTFATCPLVQIGFARVSSHPQLGYGQVPEIAFNALRHFVANKRHIFIPDSLSCTDRVLRTELMLGANQITDFYLVALARQHGFRLATLDAPLASAFMNESPLVELVT